MNDPTLIYWLVGQKKNVKFKYVLLVSLQRCLPLNELDGFGSTYKRGFHHNILCG